MAEKLIVKGNTSRNRNTAILALLLTLTIAIPIAALPGVSAQNGKTTFPYIGAVPNPVGVNQEVLLHIGITDALSNVALGYQDLSVEVIHPDGQHVTTIDGITTDSTGGTGRTFIPEEVGNYTLKTIFPEQSVGSTAYAASESDPLTLVVQEEPIPYYPAAPLPTEYWTRPIDPQLREWEVIAGHWLAIPPNLYAPYNDDAPDTAHILWTKVLENGGLAGGIPYGAQSFEIGDAYEGKFNGALIVAGKLYYNEYGTSPNDRTVCVDLHTGEEIWAIDDLTVSFGQTLYFSSYNYHGVFDYLWATEGGGFFGGGTQTWHAYDPLTGDFMMTVEDVPSGTSIYGPMGEILKYTVSGSTLRIWNLTRAVVGASAGSWGSTANVGNTFDGANGVQSTITLDKSLSGQQVTFYGDRIIGGSLSTTSIRLWGVNLNPAEGEIGEILFDTTTEAPDYWAEDRVTVSGFGGGWMAWSGEDKVGVMWVKETREHYGFSLETGEMIWGPSEPQYYLDSVDDSTADVRHIAYGRLYCASVSGIVYCYNVTTGDRLWAYEANDPYSEILWANNWWQKPVFITDGKIYVGHTEHSPINPMPRGAPFICLNATTDNPEGEVIWRADGMFRQTRWGGRAIIGDSIIATMDTYDQRVYAIGKGPSATTVSAGPEVSVEGTSVVVSGYVTDISPGTEDYGLRARFPNGVPAVCDDNMSDWMLYVYKQFAKPAEMVGVDVTITVVDPNGNTPTVANATSDASGFYSCTFVPEVPGKYTVIATFCGSGAYYGSYAEAAINVDQAPEPTPTPTPTPAPMTDAYVLGLGGASIAAIVAIGLVIILMLRKR